MCVGAGRRRHRSFIFLEDEGRRRSPAAGITLSLRRTTSLRDAPRTWKQATRSVSKSWASLYN
ncbi:MAG: hypothetical protein ACYTXA_29215 [Nostoc sp.]